MVSEQNYQRAVEEYIGGFGVAQLLIVLAASIPNMILTWEVILIGVTSTQPKWWTVDSAGNRSDACPQWPNQTVIFDNSTRNIITDWGLVCDLSWVPTTIAMVQMVGILIGGAIGGHFGDRIGRRRFMLIAFVLQILGTFVQAFSVGWPMLLVCIFVVGVGFGGFLIPKTILILEFVGTKYRTAALATPFWGMGTFTFGPLLCFFPYWKHLSFAVVVAGVPSIIFIWLAVPESVRWQLTKNKLKEAEQTLKTLARRNKRDTADVNILEECLIYNKTKSVTSTYTYLSLFKQTAVRKRLFIMSFMWFTCSFTYYILTMNVGQLYGNTVVNFMIMGAAEMLQPLIVWVLTLCIGRRTSTILFFVLTTFTSFGVTIAYFAADDSSFDRATQILAILSRTAIVCAWKSAGIATHELFPTVIRALAIGFVSVVCRLGGILASQGKLLSKLPPHWTFTIIGGLTLLCSLFGLLLNETIALPMDDFLDESESSSKSAKEEDEELSLMNSNEESDEMSSLV